MSDPDRTIKQAIDQIAVDATEPTHPAWFLVQINYLTDAFEKIILGAERKIMMVEKDREQTACH